MINLFKTFYCYCIVQYYLLWPVRIAVSIIPFFIVFSLSFVWLGGSVDLLADESSNQDEAIKISIVDRLPHNSWKDDRAAAEPVREELRKSDFLNRSFDFKNLKDQGDVVEVNYTEELRPYMYKKHMVDARDYEYFRQLDNPPPRRPFKEWLKDHLTLKNLAIGTVLFVGSMILLGYIDEKLDGAIMDDLLELQRQAEADVAKGWAIELERWEAFKRWWGYGSDGGTPPPSS